MKGKVLTVFLLFVCLTSIVGAGWAASSGVWISESPLPQIRADLPAVGYNGLVYVFGGYHDSSTAGQAEVFAFNPSANSWTQKSSMNYPRWGAAAAVYNGMAYVFAGSYAGASSNKVETYNFASNSWATKRNLPAALSAQGLESVTVGSQIYLFYGSNTYSYDPSTDTYKQLANAPYSKDWAECAYVNVAGEDRIYILGGYGISTSGAVGTCAYFRPAYNDWTVIGSAPYAAYGTLRDNPVVNGIIYYGYGQGPGVFYSYLYSFNPSTGVWTQLPSGAHPRDGVGCGVVGGNLYVIGGRSSWSNPIMGLNYNEEFSIGVSQLSVSVSPTKVRLDVGQSKVFTASVSGGDPPYGYQWYCNDIEVDGATSNRWTFTSTEAGSYDVFVIVTDAVDGYQVQSNVVSDIVVYDQPSVWIDPVSSDMTVGALQQFSSYVAGGMAPYNYQWYYDNGTAISGGTASDFSFVADSAGTYGIYLEATDHLNSIAQSDIADINVYSQPEVTISPDSTNMTIGGMQRFYSDANGGLMPYAYQWCYSNGTAIAGEIASNLVYKANITGSYSFYLNVMDELGSLTQSNMVTVNVNSQPTAIISPSLANMTVGSFQKVSSVVTGGLLPYSYQWFVNGSKVSGATGNSLTFNATSVGSYSVTLEVMDNYNVTTKSNVAILNVATPISPSPSPTPTPTPSPDPSSSPSPTPSISPSPSPSPSPNPTPISQTVLPTSTPASTPTISPAPSQSPTESPTTSPSSTSIPSPSSPPSAIVQSSSTMYILASIVVISVAICLVAILLFRRKL